MQTITFSRVGDLEIKFDLDVPADITGALPAVICIHGGGMVAGSRNEPGSARLTDFIRDFALSRGFLFISTDYRLIWPSTGLDIIDDVKTLFAFLADPSFSETYLPTGVSLDAARIVALGGSAGGYVARAAGIYANPKPIALVSIFGAGGAMLTDFWVKPKAEDQYMPFPGADRVTAESLAHLLRSPPAPVTEAPIKVQPDGQFTDDEGRIGLLFHWWRTGEVVDYLLGEKVSATLRALPEADRYAAVPEHLRPAILEAHIDASFPPTYFIHGENDGIVLAEESRVTHARLRELGVRTELEVIPGGTHGLMTKTVPPAATPGAQEAYQSALLFLENEIRRHSVLV